MIPEGLTGLSPSQEVPQGWTTVENARAWASLSAEVLREFLGPPGNRDIGNFPLAGTVDSATVRRTILEVRMPVAADAAASEGTDDPAEAPPPPSECDDSGKDPARFFLLHRPSFEIRIAPCGCGVRECRDTPGGNPKFAAGGGGGGHASSASALITQQVR